MKSTFTLVLILLITLNSVVISKAQSKDTIQFNDLLALAMQNNYGILITKSNVEINQLNNTYGNAGFLPVVGVSAYNNYSLSDNKSVFYDGTESINNGVGNNTLDALVQMNWTFFDGSKMFVTKSRLNELEKRGALQLQLEMEKVYLQLASAYYALVQEQKLEEVLKYTLEIGRFRLDLAEKKFKLGAASEIDRIQASLDLSNDSSMLLKEQTRIVSLKANINQIVGRLPDIQFTIDTKMEMGPELNYSELEKSLLEQNRSLLLAKNYLKVKELEVKETRSNFLPSLSLYGDYEYYRSHNSKGSLELNQSIGPSVGLRLSYNIFNGFNDNRKRQISKIEYQSAQLEAESELNAIRSDLYQNYNEYSSAITQITLESANLENARKNLQFAIELYKLGSISQIDFREIQRKEFDAENRLLFAQYYAKIAEIQLLQISGNMKF